MGNFVGAVEVIAKLRYICIYIYIYINIYTYFLITYLLTAWSRVLLEKLTGSRLVKRFPSFYGT